MKHFHHTIAFTLNERRFIYFGAEAPNKNSSVEENAALDESIKLENQQEVEGAARMRIEQAKADPLVRPEYGTSAEDAMQQENKVAELGAAGMKASEVAKTEGAKIKPEPEGAIAQGTIPLRVPKLPDEQPVANQVAQDIGNLNVAKEKIITNTPAPVVINKNNNNTPNAQDDTAPTAPTLPPSNEAIPLEPAATAEAAKPNEAAGTTQEVSVDGSATEADASAEPKAAEQTDEKLPETHREVLQKQMDANMAILKDTGASAADKIAAAIGMMGLLKDLMERAYKGTLDDKLGKDGEKATDKPADGSPDSTTANLTPAESAQKKVEENAKVKEGKQTPENFNKNIDEVKEKNQVERESNTKEIAELDTTIDETKKENDGLIDARGGLEKELNGLNGKEGSEGKQKILQAKIENINDKIAANTKLISALDTQRDTLVEQNKKLDEEDKELNRMKKDVNETLAKVTELLEQIVKLLKEQGLDAKMPKITIAVNPDGTTDVSTDSKDKETSATVEVKEGGEKDLATVDELQNKLVQTVQTQEKSIRAQVNDGANSTLGFAKNIGLGMLNSLGIEQTKQPEPKNVLSDGEIQLDGSTIAYDTAEKQWKSSGDLTQENQKIITSMNQDLKNITDQIAKLEQVA